MRLLPILGVLLLLSACQPDAPVGLQAETHFELVDADVVSIKKLHGRAPEADNDNEALPASSAFQASVIPASQALSNALRNSEDWRGADTQVRAFLANTHPDPSIQAWREIHVASAFLPGHLVNSDELTPEKQEAIAFYATLLIENRQLGGDKVTHALDRLEGFWPEAKLAEARQLVAQAQQTRVPSA